MNLYMDFSLLKIATSKMNGLESLVKEIREQCLSYKEGLDIAIDFVTHNNGQVLEDGDMVVLALNNEKVTCFQPYPDIDRFYYES